jgi:hypothetical protein
MLSLPLVQIKAGSQDGDVVCLEHLGFPIVDSHDGECGHQFVHLIAR